VLRERLRYLALAAVPLALTMLLLMAFALPVAVPVFGMVAPSVGLLSVYYWSLYRPDLMTPGTAFLIGLFADLLGGGPLGLTALVLVLVQWFAVSQRPSLYGKSYAVGWLGLAVLSAVAAGAYWIAASAVYLRLLDPGPVAVQATVSILTYPIFSALFAGVRTRLGEAR
jgi:rod shape-determining protein MreD